MRSFAALASLFAIGIEWGLLVWYWWVYIYKNNDRKW